MSNYYYNAETERVLEVTPTGMVLEYKSLTSKETPQLQAEEEVKPRVKTQAAKRSWTRKLTSEDIPMKRRGRQPGSKNKPKIVGTTTEGEPLFVPKSRETEQIGLPKDLVQLFGSTAVQAILEAKNRGIGFTAHEIFDMGLPEGCGHLQLTHVEQIVEVLEDAGL